MAMILERISDIETEPEPKTFEQQLTEAAEHLKENPRAKLTVTVFDDKDEKPLKRPEGLQKFDKAFVFDPLGAPLKMYQGDQEVFIFGPVTKKDREKVFESLGFNAANFRKEIVHSSTPYMGKREYYVPKR